MFSACSPRSRWRRGGPKAILEAWSKFLIICPAATSWPRVSPTSAQAGRRRRPCSSPSERLGLDGGGLKVPEPLADAEHKLYALISREGSDAAHSRYNALIRRLVSFERALGCVKR